MTLHFQVSQVKVLGGLPEGSIPPCPRSPGGKQETFHAVASLAKPVGAARVRDVQDVMWVTGISQSEIY